MMGISFIACPCAGGGCVVEIVCHVSTNAAHMPLESVPTQGQRVNAVHQMNTKGTHTWEAGGSATLCWEGKTGGSATFKPFSVHV
eukprot:6026553-Ditylum_brightwellii.AAC.1